MGEVKRDMQLAVAVKNKNSYSKSLAILAVPHGLIFCISLFRRFLYEQVQLTFIFNDFA